MADYGKLNFSVSFNPTSAFPLDARSYFESFTDAQNAAAKAEEAGSTNTVYYIGQKLLVVEDGTATWYTIQPDKSLLEDGTGGSGGSNVYVGSDTPPEDAEVWIDPSAALEDGDVPSIKVEQTENGATITATGWNGTTTAKIKDGKNGSTPVKGTDYFTEIDKAEMVAAINASMPVETWTFTLEDGTTVTKKVFVYV